MLPKQPIKLSNSYKSLMKCGELSNKHFRKNKAQLSPMRKLLFSHYKSLGTISYHSNKSSYLTGIKNITFVEGNVLNKYAKFHLHSSYSF